MAKPEFTGMTFGQHYEIRDLLEDNGIIHTYRAFQQSLNRTVAVHVLAPQERRNAHWVKAFARGAEIAAHYAHPNIVPVYDRGNHEGIDYAVVRLMEGGALAFRLQDGPLEIAEATSMVKQIAAALDYVHSHGACHGDPATINVVHDDAGNAYIADFYLMGLLMIMPDPGMMAGVPAFLAPER